MNCFWARSLPFLKVISLQKRAAKITVENLWMYRFVIQHWVSTADLCASKDLDACQVWFYLPAKHLMFLGTLFSWFDIPAFETAKCVLDLSQ